mmetsp:Transcript_11279/g.16577  ORF Transcript_11279/g.16577 Transcript_11279/m.16577 type:complete len:484 (-) Transcript_11279:36-1487(-)
MESTKEDLDNFLATVESKVRGPFSSLEIAKAVTSTRGLTPRQYLEQVRSVFHDMDKVTKVRVLVALLGLDPSEETDDIIYDLYTTAQEEKGSVGWVRVVAGLNRGIMFQNSDLSSCRGEDAQRLLEKSCKEILERVLQTEEHTDTDPLFSPYLYSLLSSDILERVLPDCLHNSHFKVNSDAAILKEDEQIEEKRCQDSQAAIVPRGRNAAIVNGKERLKTETKDLPTMPGIRTLQNPASARQKPAAGKSSMFAPARRPSAALGRGGLRGRSNVLRRPGTARALVANNRGGPGALASSGNPKLGASRGKMKMMDSSEVEGLQKERMSTSVQDRKRKLMQKAKASGLFKKAKNEGESQTSAALANRAQAQPKGDGALPNSIPAPYEEKQLDQPVSDNAPPGEALNGDWTQHLEKSNKLTEEDRERVKQFFVDRVNPTPLEPVVRVKLNEEKTVKPETGLTIKETLYLELDYTTFGFKKLRKTKKK